MRFLIILLFISVITGNVVYGNFFYKQASNFFVQGKKQEDSTVYKTVLIGKVTEISYSYSFINQESFLGDSINNFTNHNVHSWALTQYFIVNNFLIQSGIEYSTTTTGYLLNYSRDSVFSKQVMVYDTINTHYYIVNGDSIPEYVIDQYYITETDTIVNQVIKTDENEITCVIIPLNIGYRWRFDKFALYGKIGTRFNFITQTTGKVFLSDNLEWVKFEKKIEKKFYCSATASMAFEYPFSALGSVIIEPEYCYSWFSQVNSGFTQNYHRFGVKLGIQFWF